MSNLFKKIAVVALLVVTVVTFGGVVAPVQAQSVSELQAQLAQLQQQLATLQGGTSAYVWTRNLTIGSTGEDVRQLQIFLNTHGSLVAPASDGAGRPGFETTYFGVKTRAALAVWQSRNNIAPAVGFFGPITRARVNAIMAAVVVVPTPVPVPVPVPVPTPTPTPVPPAGSFAVTLSADNPAGSTLVAGQAAADLLHFTVWGTGTVTNLKFMRTGVSTSATLSNVYLFDGFTRLSDAATINNFGEVNFNVPSGLFTVNGSRNISVRADVAANTAGQTIGLNFVSGVMSATNLTGSANGNLFNIASATLAAADFGTVTPNGGTINPGPAITLWQSTVNVSNRDVYLDRIAFRQTGSAPASALANFKLYVNGVVVATAAGLDANGYVTFVPTTPTLLVTGSRIFRVDADVVSGASRTIHLSLRSAADVWLRDSQLGVNITATGIPATATTAITISGTAGGSLTLEKDTTSPSQNITLNATDTVLARFKATAFGEAIKIENLRATFTASDAAVGSLRNGRIMIDGAQYGSTTTLNEDSQATPYTSYTLNYIVNPGTPVIIEVRADIFDNDGTNDLTAGDTILAKLAAGSSNAVRMDSLGTFSTPASAVSGNTLTVATTSMALAENTTYTDQTVVVPQTAYKIGSWNLTGSSSEDILLSTLSFDIDCVVCTGAVDFDHEDITNMYAVIRSGGAVVIQTSPLATVVADNNNYSISYTLAKNASVSVELFGTLGSAIDANDSFKTDLTVSGTSATSGQAVTATSADTDGQTIVGVLSGTLTATVDSSNPVASIEYDNQTVTSAAFKFAAVNDGYNVTDVTLTLPQAPTTVTSVQLWDGATLLAQLPGAQTMNFSGMNWNIPANTNKVLTVKLVLGTVGVGAGTSGESLLTTLTAFTATSVATGTSDASANDAGPSILVPTIAGNAHYAYAAIPVMTAVALPSTSLTNGVQTISKFSIAPTGGNISWHSLFWEVTKDTAVGVETVITDATLWDVTGGGNTEVAGTDSITTLADGSASGSILFTATVEQQLSSTKTYELRVTTADVTVDQSFITTKLAQDAVFAAPNEAVSASDVRYADADVTIVWSDLSAASHDTTTADWNNDFGVKNLPISQTLTR